MSDTPDLTAWIGRAETATDLITPRMLASFAAMLTPHLAPGLATGLVVPPGLHWCLTPQIAPAAQLGQDGHPVMGSFLPPVPFPRRMWAGGSLEHVSPLLPGDTVHKISTIESISFKSGSTGPLCFVIVAHDFHSPRGLALRERQTLVYLPAATGLLPKPAPAPAQTFDLDWRVKIDTTLLFRYSALTFNGHRIHYDRLVIHGPLQATLLWNIAAEFHGMAPRHFEFRGVVPAVALQTMRFGARSSNYGAELMALDQVGAITQWPQPLHGSASATLRPAVSSSQPTRPHRKRRPKQDRCHHRRSGRLGPAVREGHGPPRPFGLSGRLHCAGLAADQCLRHPLVGARP